MQTGWNVGALFGRQANLYQIPIGNRPPPGMSNKSERQKAVEALVKKTHCLSSMLRACQWRCR